MADKGVRPGLGVAFRMARRELRGGLKGWRVFVACLALGVAAIAAIGSLSQAIEEGIRADARVILGGDAEFRTLYRPPTAEQRALLASRGALSSSTEMRAMARKADGAVADRLLVELKAVDSAYPLYGAVRLDPAMPLARALAPADGVPGAVVEQTLLDRLALKVGDTIRIGEARFRIAAVIAREPDRGTSVFILGPRVIIGESALAATGLIQPGSLIQYHVRVRTDGRAAARSLIADARTRYATAAWRIRDVTGAAPGLERTVERVTLYLTFVGLTALLVGGVGVAGAVGAYLAGRRVTIATLKCLGAPGRLIFQIYLIQVGALAALGIAVGLVVGAAAPFALAGVVEDQLPVALATGVFARPLVLAAAFGLLTALVFSLWPLARARDVPAAALFRDVVARSRQAPRRSYAIAAGVAAAALAVLAIWSAPDRFLAGWYVCAAVLSFLAFRLAAWLLARAAAGVGQMAQARGTAPRLRLALANLHRPGAPTPSVVLSLGLGLTVLAAVALIEGNVTNQIRERIPERAPSFFFIDIQSAQIADFDAAVASVPGVESVTRMAMLRARIVKIGGVPVRQAKVAPGGRWAVGNERGLTFAATPPAGTQIVAGTWWPADYKGPPLISFDAHLAEAMGIRIGDTLTFNILGREITARIANLRAIDWSSLGMNFTVIFAPGTLEAAPHTYIATVRVRPEQESALMAAVTEKLPNVSAVRVRDALETVGAMLARLGGAVRATGIVTLAAGLLVLAGAIAAGHRRRVYDAVVLKVLGARRRDVLKAFLIEYGALGLATAAIAALLGTAAAWAVVTGIMHANWVFLIEPLVLTAAVALAVTLVFGFAGVWRALGRKPAQLLRNE